MTTPRPPKNLMCLILHKSVCVTFGCLTCKEQYISEFVSHKEQPVSCDVFSVTGSTHLLAPWEETVKISSSVSHLSSTTWTRHGAPLSESSCRGTPILCTHQWRPLSGTWGNKKLKPQDFAWISIMMSFVWIITLSRCCLTQGRRQELWMEDFLFVQTCRHHMNKGNSKTDNTIQNMTELYLHVYIYCCI